jgi:integrase
MHFKHGAYYYVKRNQWERLSSDYAEALELYANKVDPRGGGMAELIDEVLAYIKPRLKPSTIAQYEYSARVLKPIFVEFAPEQVRPKHISAIKVSFAKTPNMANRYISFLRVVFAQAVEWQRVDSNPCVGIKRHVEQQRTRLMTEKEFQAIRDAAQHRAVPVVMDLCLLTGQRISDVLKLRNEDISPDGIFFEQKKTDAKLKVRMTPDLEATIALARVTHPPKQDAPKGTYETLLYTRGGRPYSYKTIYEAFVRARKAAGVEDVVIHDMRAKAGTDAEEQGVDPQKLLGHTDSRQTKRYLRGKKVPVVDGPRRPKAG